MRIETHNHTDTINMRNMVLEEPRSPALFNPLSEVTRGDMQEIMQYHTPFLLTSGTPLGTVHQVAAATHDTKAQKELAAIAQNVDVEYMFNGLVRLPFESDTGSAKYKIWDYLMTAENYKLFLPKGEFAGIDGDEYLWNHIKKKIFVDFDDEKNWTEHNVSRYFSIFSTCRILFPTFFSEYAATLEPRVVADIRKNIELIATHKESHNTPIVSRFRIAFPKLYAEYASKLNGYQLIAQEQLSQSRNQRYWQKFLSSAFSLAVLRAKNIIITPDEFRLEFDEPLETPAPTPLPVLKNF